MIIIGIKNKVVRKKEPFGALFSVGISPKEGLPLEGKLSTKLTDEVLLGNVVIHLIRFANAQHLPLEGKA